MGFFAFRLQPCKQPGRITGVIRLVEPFNQNPLTVCQWQPWGFLLSALSLASGLRSENKKSPSLRSVRGFWLRSVADSNRRTRFCRPMPSHSANRPCFADHAYPPAGGQPTIVFLICCLTIKSRTADPFTSDPLPHHQLADNRPSCLQK